MSNKKKSQTTHLPQSPDAVDSTPVKLHTAPDPVDPRTQHHDMLARKLDIMLNATVGQIQVVCTCWPLRCYCVNLANPRGDVVCQANVPNGNLRAEKVVFMIRVICVLYF